MKFIAIKTALTSALVWGGVIIMTSCSLKDYQGPTVNVVFDKLGSQKFDFSARSEFSIAPLGMNALPSTFDEFSCYLVNVSGDRIPPNANYEGGEGIPYESLGNECNWYLGLLSNVSSSYATTFQVDVPIGAKRAIQFVGLDSSVACLEGGSFGQFFDAPRVLKSTLDGAYSLGMTKTDIFSTQTVVVQNQFDPNTAVNAVNCHQGVGATDPGSVPGLALWLMSDDFIGLAASAPISLWSDRSIEGNSVAPVSTLPTYHPAVIGGRGVVRFSPPAVLYRDNPTGLSNLNGVTLFVVGRLNDVSMPTKYFFTAWDNPSNFPTSLNSFGLFGEYYMGFLRFAGSVRNANETLLAPDSVIADNQPVILTLSGGSSSFSTSARLYVDGTQFGSGGAATTQVNGIYKFTVGGTLFSGAPSSLSGDIAEVILYNREISDEIRSGIECQLGLKYGIPIVGHSCP